MTASQVRSRASFQTRLLLHLANRRKRRGGLGSGAAEAFTLVELMIVVAILGILAAVALPNFLQSRNAAEAGSRISEAISYAKQCSVFKTTGVGGQPTAPTGQTDIAISCGSGDNPATVSATWDQVATGVKCLDAISTADDRKATLTVTNTTMTCAFSAS